MINAAVAMLTPIVEMPAIMLIILTDFFEKRYRNAILKGTFK